jgi:hypothetical protein
VRVHLITAESPESRHLRYGRLIQFPQLTMPLIAALTPREHVVTHTDEIVEPVRFDVPADLVAITAPTPSALHAYDLAREFRRRGVRWSSAGRTPPRCPRRRCATRARSSWERPRTPGPGSSTMSLMESWSPFTSRPGRPRWSACPPRWDLIKGRRYGKSVTIATRGCPHRCDYCSIPLLYGPGAVRYRPIDRRLAGSRAGVWWNLPRNLGYMIAGLSNAGPAWDPGGSRTPRHALSAPVQPPTGCVAVSAETEGQQAD